MYFEEDDPYFTTELATLGRVFHELLDIGVEFFAIPTTLDQDHTASVDQRLRAFRGTPGVNELLVVVYGGHGRIVPDSRAAGRPSLQLVAVTSHMGKRIGHIVFRNRLQDHVLFPGNKDVLVLLDCCYAGAATRSMDLARKDILAASKTDTPLNTLETPYRRKAPAAPQSFTKYMIAAIQSFTAASTVGELKDCMIRNGVERRPVYDSRPTDRMRPIVLTPHGSSQGLIRTLMQSERPQLTAQDQQALSQVTEQIAASAGPANRIQQHDNNIGSAQQVERLGQYFQEQRQCSAHEAREFLVQCMTVKAGQQNIENSEAVQQIYDRIFSNGNNDFRALTAENTRIGVGNGRSTR
ncbi:hypothetical protein LTR62_008043 [Meristemomyces frigidus]|uniref:Caspase domain-containing protein n=1 Tax=Meristemomyces frigidus TaxID=1508187 RepID=A0AAN7TN94_9PEZI|nr:hypothetical protein LTR62_008043 [Meristemomyces frigidus]